MEQAFLKWRNKPIPGAALMKLKYGARSGAEPSVSVVSLNVSNCLPK